MSRLLGATTRQELLSAPEVLDASVDQLDEAAARLAGLVRNRRATERAALHATAAVLADRRADSAAEADEVAERHGPPGGGTSRGLGRVVVLGGELWWLAREVVRKASEMGRLPAVAERLPEAPRGPVEAVTEDGVVLVLLLALPTRGPEAAVVSRLRDLAGRVFVLGKDVGRGSVSEPRAPDRDAAHGRGGLISKLILGHLIALAAATRRGVDAPARLSPFVQVEGIRGDKDKGVQA